MLYYAKRWIEENVQQERGRRRVPVYNSTQQPLYKMPAAGATQALRIFLKRYQQAKKRLRTI